jgi:hypothetical protein
MLIREMNLLSLINLSLAYVYCSTTLLNHELIMLNKFISQISSIYIISLYLILLISLGGVWILRTEVMFRYQLEGLNMS